MTSDGYDRRFADRGGILMALLLSGLVLMPIGSAIPLQDLLGPPAAQFEEVAVPWDLPDHGAQVVLHAHIEHPTTRDRAVVFALEDTAGALLMYAVIDGGTLHVTDGYQDDGVTPRPLVDTDVPITQLWFRIDVVLSGSGYTMLLDGVSAATARLFAPASVARLADPADVPHGSGHDAGGIEIALLRHLPADAVTSTFNAPLVDAGWGLLETGPGDVSIDLGAAGAKSAGRLAIRSALQEPLSGWRSPVEGLAYAQHALPGAAGAYLVEGWARPSEVGVLQVHGVPDHQAVIAGVSGPDEAPAVHWAVVMAQVGLEHDRWAFHLVGPDGSRTQVSPTWSAVDAYWHMVRVLVDEATGTLGVQVDGATLVKRFTFDDLGAPERIAIGDVWLDHPHWTGAGAGFYDEATLVARRSA